MIISIGKFFNFCKFFFDIFSETIIMVFTLLLVCNIFDFSEMVPLESKIIRVGFFPFENRTVSKGSSIVTVFVKSD
jgi:hypothetical protein